ncbi:MAG: VWA-like domain-containing protein [Planctomycetes bacterium]|nr:VWA-like domain-containing protein [Planctomycetota bacterium]
MNPAPTTPTPEQVAFANATRALRLVSANLPHLSGLCHSVRIKVTPKYPVAAIGATGLMLVNPRVFSETPLPDLVFVVAHELMHLALDTFGRGGSSDPYLVNIAHDYVINDILSVELGRVVPLGGLVRHGARQESLETLVTELARNGTSGKPSGCWSIERKKKPKKQKSPKSAMTEALEKAGLLPPEPEEPDGDDAESDYPDGDTLSNEEEAELEPHMGPKERGAVRERIRREAVRAVSLKELRDQIEKHNGTSHGQGGDAGASETLMEAITTAYQPPWQLALQHWLDAVTPGPRSFARPSRRGADRSDGVILPGRKREGWALHVVMDTSGSMVSTLPHILGLLASFCEGAGVNQVHILQCDMGVTADEWLDPAELAAYKITGFGGSDMSPAMDALAEDAEVHAVLVLTDGYISYPAEEPPYAVLWGLVDGYSSFHPPYGTVVHVKT